MYEILLILGGMAVFYFIMILIAIKIKEKRNKQICPICATVSFTWLSLLVLREFNVFTVNPVFLAILMGGSVCGVMYLVEKKIESPRRKVFWKIASTILGVLLVVLVVSREYNVYALAVLAFYLLVLFVSLKKKKERGNNGRGEAGEIGKEKETWLKKLENCC